MSIESYDQLWSTTWGDQQGKGPVHRRQREALVRRIRELGPDSVLDVGCGAGDNLAALAKAMPQIRLAGTDVSDEALGIARRRVPGASFMRMDVQSQSLAEKFDLVLCNQVIEHLLDDIAALRHLRRMAKRWVLVATMRGRMRRSERAIGHYRNYSDVELRAKAEAADLEVVEIFGWGFPFYSPIYRTAIELVPGGPPDGKFGAASRAIAAVLYRLYGLNLPGRGDVVTMLARPRDEQEA